MVGKSKLGLLWFLFRRVGSLAADTTCMWKPRDLANRRTTLLPTEWKNVLSFWGYRRSESEFLFQVVTVFFCLWIAHTSYQGLLGISAFLMHFILLREPSHQDLTHLNGVSFIAWRLRSPLFRGMPTGPEAFLYPPDVSQRWACAWTYVKYGLVPYWHIYVYIHRCVYVYIYVYIHRCVYVFCVFYVCVCMCVCIRKMEINPTVFKYENTKEKYIQRMYLLRLG